MAVGGEIRALSKLTAGPASAGSLRLTAEQVSALAAEGLVVTRPGRRGTVMLEITLAGRERAAAAPPPPAKKLSTDARLQRIEEILGKILERLPPPAPARPLGEVKQVLMATIADLDSARRYGGLVPIPEIRRAVRDISDEQVTAGLEALEQ